MAHRTYSKVLGDNLRAARARLPIGQDELASRMRKLGYGAWVRQTVSRSERGERRPAAEEIPGLAIALETTVARLMQPDNGQEVQLQDGGPVMPADYVRDAVFGKVPGGVIAWGEDRLTIEASPLTPEMVRMAEQIARDGRPGRGEEG
jgi:transcriptional regulator with XRE-family HTH domain